MTAIHRAAAALRFTAAIAFAVASCSRESGRPGPVEAAKIATEAYVYGYPLVTFDMAREQQTNVAAPDAEQAPVGQVIKMRTFPAVDNHCCAAPNAETLYTEIWLDVSKEPWIVSTPDMGDRYYIIPFLDGWSEVIAVSASNINGGKARTFAVTGPGWSGPLPAGVTEIKSPTGMVWVLGRIYTTGTPADYAAVHALQDRFTSVPLSAYGKAYTPTAGTVDPGVDMKTGVRAQVNALSAIAYFTRLAALMKTNPPVPADSAMVARMARIGLVPGKDFDATTLGLLDEEALKLVPKAALLHMGILLKERKTEKGWLLFTQGVGNFGTDYRLRGMANLLGPGWNRPQDAVYPLTQKDSSGVAYDGAARNYVIHFAKGQLPPVDGFWSVTMYDPEFFFVPNAINRYSLNMSSKFVPNADGSVDFYLQAASPGKARESNWLPAPKGKFYLVMRLYVPRAKAPSIFDGTWTPPAVRPMS